MSQTRAEREEAMSVDLFGPFKIGNLVIRNRFMRSATYDGTADEKGAVTERSLQLYERLGKGHIGLIVTGHAFISLRGQAGAGQYGIYSDEMVPGLKRLTDVVHRSGGKIAVQIAHCGINSNYMERTGSPALAVSATPEAKRPHVEMTDAEIEAVIGEFEAAARRAAAAGFDAVQLHGAHGYLMSQFLSPLMNFRKDRWGGSPENRRRFHLEVVKRLRNALPKDIPLLIKFGPQDDQEGGLKLEEGLETARQMVANGLDAIEVSGGVGMSPITKTQTPFRERAAAVKRALSVPIALVSGIRDGRTCQSIVDSGDADLISMSRPFVREPGLIARWEANESDDAKCISCSRCFAFPRHGLLLCGQDNKLPPGETQL
jgi:2,4-dienoyl-CoA reductase-like NADH-dependent reductase (Old Yellow Enzyme family)